LSDLPGKHGVPKGSVPIDRKQISGTCHEWTGPRGSFRVERVSKNAIVFTPRGHLSVEFFDLFASMVDDAIADGRPHLFWDGEKMVSYDTDFRVRLGKYCVQVKPRVSSMNVYTPQPLVAMGAAVINVWLGGFFTMHKTREALLETLLRARASAPR
jgi:hypothetical protein